MEFKIKELTVENNQSDDVFTYGGRESADKVLKINIEFEKGEKNELFIYEKDNIWYPADVEHEENLEEDCLICEDNYDDTVCYKYVPYINELFEIVMKHPKIRIKKMFV